MPVNISDESKADKDAAAAKPDKHIAELNAMEDWRLKHMKTFKVLNDACTGLLKLFNSINAAALMEDASIDPLASTVRNLLHSTAPLVEGCANHIGTALIVLSNRQEFGDSMRIAKSVNGRLMASVPRPQPGN